ncbi:MAG: C4-dicarboxylate transporter/malic acid transport protein [Bacillales bacterium]|jgi:exfoliative toxin A/B|nr:C4-dicarboxylate transporter/malic acid transport protein [Bacillales bacterium]
MNLKKVVASTCGVALALATLGNLLGTYSFTYKYICGSLSVLLLTLFVIRIIKYPIDFKEELLNPVSHSVLPTVSMALMVLSTYIKPFTTPIALAIWLLAIGIHLLIVVSFIIKFIFNFSIRSVFASWFVVGVGIVVVSVTAPVYGMDIVGKTAFYIGISIYFILVPTILYRIFKIRELPKPSIPLNAIFAAPMSLCIVGYFLSFKDLYFPLIIVMLALSIISYIYAFGLIVFKIRGQFVPSFAAFTFPTVISAVAYNKVNTYFTSLDIHFFSFMPMVSLIIAILVVSIVLLRFCVYWFSQD